MRSRAERIDVAGCLEGYCLKACHFLALGGRDWLERVSSVVWHSPACAADSQHLLFHLRVHNQRKDCGVLDRKSDLHTFKPTSMRGYLSGIIKAVFIILFILRIWTMLNDPTPIRARLSLTYSRLTRPITGGLAPRINCHVPPDLLDKDEYSIILKCGHTMEQHKRAVGRSSEIDAVIQKVLDYPFPGFQVTYFARVEDGGLLNAIRADPGVDFVECDIVQEADLAVFRGEE